MPIVPEVLGIIQIMRLLSLRLYAMLSFNHEFCTTFIAARHVIENLPMDFIRVVSTTLVPAQMPHIITFCKTRCTSNCNRLRKDPRNDSAFTSFSGQDSHHRHTFETAAA